MGPCSTEKAVAARANFCRVLGIGCDHVVAGTRGTAITGTSIRDPPIALTRKVSPPSVVLVHVAVSAARRGGGDVAHVVIGSIGDANTINQTMGCYRGCGKLDHTGLHCGTAERQGAGWDVQAATSASLGQPPTSPGSATLSDAAVITVIAGSEIRKGCPGGFVGVHVAYLACVVWVDCTVADAPPVDFTLGPYALGRR